MDCKAGILISPQRHPVNRFYLTFLIIVCYDGLKLYHVNTDMKLYPVSKSLCSTKWQNQKCGNMIIITCPWKIGSLKQTCPNWQMKVLLAQK